MSNINRNRTEIIARLASILARAQAYLAKSESDRDHERCLAICEDLEHEITACAFSDVRDRAVAAAERLGGRFANHARAAVA